MLEISKSDITARLRFDNPWWKSATPETVPFSEKPRRKYFPSFMRRVAQTEVNRAVVVMGPRRVGKTVMVYHAIHNLIESGVSGTEVLYLSLETPIYTGMSLEAILLQFLDIHGHTPDTRLYVFFDEVQYLKSWEVHLKSLVDSFPRIRFTVTGSAAAALRLQSKESGAGRFTDFVLPPLTFAEYLQFIGREEELMIPPDEDVEHKGRKYHKTTSIESLNAEFVNYLNFGGYPEAVFSEAIRANPEQYIKSDIIDKVLLRDLPSLYGISDIQELNKLFTVLAYNTGNEVSLENISKSSGVAKNTIKRYLEYLEAAFLIRRVERIDQNARRFQRAMCFKVYLTNPSMRAALFGKVDEDAECLGSLVETAIFSQWQHSKSATLYYARWKTGEVDIVYQQRVSQKPVWAVEVKWSDRPYRQHDEIAGFLEFARLNKGLHLPLLVTSYSVEAVATVGEIPVQFVPSSIYAYTLGVNLLDRLDRSAAVDE